MSHSLCTAQLLDHDRDERRQSGTPILSNRKQMNKLKKGLTGGKGKNGKHNYL